MSGVHKVARRRGRRLIQEWVPATDGTRIDYRDCEVYQVAAAYWLNVHLLPPESEIERMRHQQVAEVTKPRKRKRGSGFEVKRLDGYL